MSVLDNKYEIITHQLLEDGQQVFKATAADGSDVRIAWFELRTPQEEYRFETYRQILRRLRKQNLVAIHDIVSRPGAHYVTWAVHSKAPRGNLTPAMREILKQYGYQPGSASVRLINDHNQIVHLPFDPAASDVIEEEEKPPVKAPARPLSPTIISWLVSASLLLGAFFVLLGGFIAQSNRNVVTLPDFSGQTIQQATEQLRGLKLAANFEAVASDEPAGTILSTTPSAGTDLKPYFQSVTLRYAAATEQANRSNVPDLRNQEFDQSIQRLLNDANLQLGDVALIPSNIVTNRIISQSPPALSSIPQGSRVNLLISSGPTDKQTFLPNLLGLNLDEAQYLVQVAGLPAAELEFIPTSQVPRNTVLAQSIPPGIIIPASSSLRLSVATATLALPSQPIPSLIGLSLTEARQLASAYSLSVQELDTPNLPAGVVNQFPAPGTAASSNEIIVTVNVYTRPVAIPVPMVQATVRSPEARVLSYSWLIEPGIRATMATVQAFTLQGESYDVSEPQLVQGGQTISGSWETSLVGPITFRLFLDGIQYSVDLQRN